MASRTRTTAALVALAALALTASACTATPPTATNVPVTTPATSTAAATTSAGPAATTPAAPTASSGPIATPASGTALRAAILKAAAAGLGVSGSIIVHQLFAQGSAAAGDITPAGGTRTFFALTGGPGAWKLAWSAPFGSSLANAAALETAVPLVSPTLAAKIVWSKTLTSATSASAAPTLASFKAFAAKSAKTFAGSVYTGPFTITAKIAKDPTGLWWGNASAVPATDGLDPIGVWGSYAAGKWSGQIADYSTEDAESSFFPADVIAKLELP